MRGLPTSPRRRRRLLWAAALVLAAAAIVAVALATRHSGGREPQARPGRVANPAAERTVPLRAADRRRIDVTVARFVATAVARRTAASYDLVTPAFRGGTTRAQWALGDIPVYPYPADVHSAGTPQIVGSYPNDVLVNLLLQPRPRAKAGPILFNLELKRQHARWLVDSFQPLEVYAAPGQPRPARTAAPNLHRAKKSAQPGSGFDQGRLSTTWFLLPVGIFLLIVLVPLGLWLKGWRAGRRADRLYGGKKSLPPLPPRRT